MQKIKNIVKKIAAISTGAAMLGATLTGALAADLSSYPAPFVNVANKQFDYMLVLGSGASGAGAAKDTAGAIDIAGGLAAVPVAGGTGGTTTIVTGGVSEDIPLTLNIAASNQIDNILDDGDINSLFDGTITFQSANYDTSETLYLNLNKNASVQTSLSSSDDDYKSDVALELEKGSMQYIYSFDSSILVNATTTSNPLDIDFLGKRMRITAVASATKVTAQVGQEYFMNSGESVTVNGKTVKLERVGSNGDVLINIDGVTETLTNGATRTVNGVEINNDAQFYDSNNQAASAANLVLGKDAVESITDGDGYFGGDDTCSSEDPKDPDCWKFIVKSMHTTGTSSLTNTASSGVSYGTTGPILGLKSDFALNDDKDDPPKVGDCVSFPNDYLSVCFDSLSTDDEDNMELTMSRDTGFDSETSEAGIPNNMTTSSVAILLQSSANDALVIDVDATNFVPNGTQSSDIKGEKIWVAPLNRNAVAIYYENSNGVTQLAGTVLNDTQASFGYLDYNKIRGTSGTSMALIVNSTHFGGATAGTDFNGTGSSINIIVEPADSDLAVSSDTLWTNWTLSNDDVNALGVVQSSEEAGEFVYAYVNAPGGTGAINLGTKDEDHRSRFGIILKDPKGNGASDKVRLSIPQDMMQANIVVKGTAAKTTQTSGSATVISAVDTAPSPVIDTEVVSKTTDNLILVGGPAVNKLSAEFMGLAYPTYGTATGLSEGEAIISLKTNGDKVAMIVAGWAAEDTQRAAKVLKDYKAHVAELKGMEVSVKGTSASPTIVASTA